jgi:cytoskeleton protein RodZ
MTDNPSPTAPEVDTAAVVVNNGHLLLAQARQTAGLGLDALSLALKVPVRRLESLEAGRYEELPDMTFARALAMSVCRYLQIDAQVVLERMPSAHVARLGDQGALVGDTMYNTGEGLALSPVSVLRRPPVLVAMALLLAAALLYSLPEATDPPPVDAAPASEPATVPAAQAPAVPFPAPIPATESSAAPADVPVPSSTTVSVAAPPAPPPVPIEPAAAPVAPNRSVVLRVSAQEETWLEVVRPDGTVLMGRLLKSGDVVDMGSAPPYTVVLGRASAAQVFVRGQAIPLAPHTRGDVARYEVK